MKNGSLLCCIFNLQGQSWNLRAPRVVLSEIGRNQISWQSEPLQARDIASSPEFHQRHSDYPTSYEWSRICVHLWENLWLNRSCRLYIVLKKANWLEIVEQSFFKGEFPSPSLRTSPSPPLEAEPVIIVIIFILIIIILTIIVLIIFILIIIVLITTPWALTSSSWSA